MPTNSISSQLWELKNGGTGAELYSHISSLSSSQLHSFFASHIKNVRETAQRVGVDLIESQEHKPHPLSTRKRPRFPQVNTDTTVTTWQPAPDDDELQPVSTPTRPAKRSNTTRTEQEPNQTINFLPTRVRTENVPLKHPYFLYRTYEIDHGFKARRFLYSSEDPPPPPRFKSQHFRKKVERHLSRDQSYQSPFVSLAENPAAAIRRGLEKVTKGLSIALAIFSFEDLKMDQVQRYGPDTGPYLVDTICKYHDLWDLPGAYTGTGEFLIWGSIKIKPVAVFSDVDMLMIRAILRTTYNLDHFAGSRLAKYIPTTDDLQHLELFIYQLVTGFKTRGYKTARKSAAYREFFRGILSKPGHALDDPMEITSENEDDDDDDYDMVETPSRINQTDTPVVNDRGEDDFEMVLDPYTEQKKSSYPVFAWRDDSESVIL